MTAAAGAARFSDHLLIDRVPLTVALAVGAIVAAGLVEGTALGFAQALTLRRALPRLRVRWYVAATVLVAGLGWAAGSVPSILSARATVESSAAADSGPAWWLMLLGGAGLGLAMGVLLGIGQALALRREARKPWRWVTANAIAWTPAMAVLMLGASLPGESWGIPLVVAWAAVVGGLAGGILGLVLSLRVGSLGGAAPTGPVTVGLGQ